MQDGFEAFYRTKFAFGFQGIYNIIKRDFFFFFLIFYSFGKDFVSHIASDINDIKIFAQVGLEMKS
jgi:hypothetical protein